MAALVASVALLAWTPAAGATESRSDIAPVPEVAAACDTSLLVRADGTAWSWGANEAGQLGDGTTTSGEAPRQVLTAAGTPLTAVTAVALGCSSGYALRADGSVWAWGSNEHGQLGIGSTSGPEACGTTPCSRFAVRVQAAGPVPLDAISEIAAGDSHAVARRADGTAWAWGRGDSGQLGNGSTSGPEVCVGATCSTLATQVQDPTGVAGSLARVIDVAAGSGSSVALLSDGTLRSWGSNVSGATGLGSESGTTLAPAAVQQASSELPLDRVRSIDGAGATYVALRSDGTLHAWGAGSQGQLGDGTTSAAQSRSVPVLAASGSSPLDQVREVSAGADHTVAVRADGSVWAWGRNDWGQLGDATRTQRTRPVQVATSATPTHLGMAMHVAAGGTHSLAILADGTVSAWGDDLRGQLGLGTPPPACTGGRPCVSVATASSAPVGGGHRAVAASWFTSFAIAADGTVLSWGDNRDGELGIGVEDGMTSGPRQVLRAAGTPLDGVVAIVGGAEHGAALRADGSVWVWGDNGSGQLAQGSTSDSDWAVPMQQSSGVQLRDAVALSAIDRVTYVLRADGQVRAVGRNTYGAIGDGTTTQATYPVAVQQLGGATLDRVVALSGRGGDADHVTAVRDDGTAWAWGFNREGQLGQGVSSGPESCGSTACGTRARQVLQANGTPLTGIVSAAASFRTGHAVTDRGWVLSWGGNVMGELGNATTWTHFEPWTFRLARNDTNSQWAELVTDVASGDQTPVGRLADGRAVGWGDNQLGQVGDNQAVSAQRFMSWVAGVGGTGHSSMIESVESGADHGIARDGLGRVLTWGSDGYGQLGSCTATYGVRRWPEPVQSSCSANRPPNPTYGETQYRSDGTTVLSRGTWTNETTIVIRAAASDPDDAQSLRLFVEIRPNHVPFSAACGDTTDSAVFASSASSGTVQGRSATRTVTITGLADGTQYHWRLCVRDGGGTGLAGPWYVPEGNPDISVDTSTPPAGTFGSMQVRAQCDNTGVVLADGTVWMAGDGTYGQLGNGTTTGLSSTPVQVRLAPAGAQALTNVRSLAVGCGFAVAVRTDGTVFAWGRNDRSQLGAATSSTCDATTCSEWAVQVDPTNVSQVKEVAAGDGFALALRADGRVLAWGDNANGRLGRGTVGGTSATAAAVRNTANTADLANVVTISAGSNFAAASDVSGAAWTWGSNATDRLGAGLATGSDHATAQRVLTAAAAQLGGVRAVEAGAGHALALRHDGTLWSWGDNTSGQLGTNTAGGAGSYASPVRDSTGTTLARWTRVAAGGSHTTAIRADGTVWSWGLNTSGQLGQASNAGTACGGTCEPAPVQTRDSGGALVTDATAMFKAIDAGSDHVVALRASGQAWSWGRHHRGQLARAGAVGSCPNGDPCASSLVSTDASTGRGYLQPLGRGWGNGALRADGTVVSWADNAGGQFGNGTTNGQSPRPQVVEVAAGVPLGDIVRLATGEYATYAVRADGTVWSWGNGGSGRLGNNTTSSRTRAVQVRSGTGTSDSGPILFDIVEVAGHDQGGFALDAGGIVWSWGENERGELASGACCSDRLFAAPVLRAAGTNLTAVVGIGANAADGDDGFAVRADGSVWAWGQNGDGQLGQGSNSGPDLCGSNACSLYAVQVREGVALTPISRVVAVDAADDAGYALKADGTAWSWGSGSSGRLGNNGTDARYHAVQVRATAASVDSGTALTGGIALASADDGGAVVDAQGRLLTWGQGSSGELGSASWSSRSHAAPARDTAGVDLVGIRVAGSGGASHGASVVSGGGAILTTGSNGHYQLGDCTRVTRSGYAPIRETCPGNLAPAVRWQAQYRSNHSTSMPAGAWTSDGITTNVYLDFNASDPDGAETVTPYIEFAPLGTPFSATCADTSHPNVRAGTPTATGDVGGAVSASFPVTGLTAGVQYHWRACASDGAGSISPWVSMSSSRLPAFGVDDSLPANPSGVDDGPVRGADVETTTSLTVLEATWPFGLDAGGSGLVRYDYCVTTLAGGDDCASGATRTWTNNGYASELRATGLTLVHGTRYHVCVRSHDGAGNAAIGHTCSNGQVPSFSLTAVNPDAGVQGDTGVLLELTGSGFLSTDSVTVLGDGITVTSVTRISDTRLDVRVDIGLSASAGKRTVRVAHTGSDTSQVELVDAFTVTAHSISISLSTLGYTDPARDASAPHGISFGSLLPGVVRQIGPDGSGQAVAGAATQVSVVSNGAWRLQHSATDFSTGSASLPAASLSWKHHGAAEPWSAFSTSAATIEGTGAGNGANAPGGTTYSYDWQLTVPAGQPPGSYASSVTYTAIPAV